MTQRKLLLLKQHEVLALFELRFGSFPLHLQAAAWRQPVNVVNVGRTKRSAVPAFYELVRLV